jgi:hypothetical protein
MRQVKSGVSHTGNRFSEPVAIAFGHILRTISSMHTALSTSHERSAYILTDAGSGQSTRHTRAANRWYKVSNKAVINATLIDD